MENESEFINKGPVHILGKIAQGPIPIWPLWDTTQTLTRFLPTLDQELLVKVVSEGGDSTCSLTHYL